MSERQITEIPADPARRNPTTNGRPLRVAAYCRVSTDSEEQLSSYHSQIEYYTAVIIENPDWQLAGIFADEGISGTSTKNRKEFNKMIRKCEHGKIDLILTKSVSRFARNTLDCLNYIRHLKALGVGIIFEKEGVNTLESDDETFVTISGIMAQSESVSLSKNVRMGYQQNFKAGKVPYHIIMGYRKSADGNLEIVPEEAEIIKRIFARYLAGHSVGRIKKDLEADGIKTYQGKDRWSEGALRHILRNEKYMGDVLLQKTFTENVLTGKMKKNMGEFPPILCTE